MQITNNNRMYSKEAVLLSEIFYTSNSEGYSEPCQMSKMELFAKK